MKLVKMFGPSLSEPDKMVDRDVPEADVQAFRAAGYKEGSLPKKEEAAEAPEVEAPKAKKGKKK